MREFFTIYETHKTDIEKFLIETLRRNTDFIEGGVQDVAKLFEILPSLELIYLTDTNYRQTSPNVSRRKTDERANGRNRAYLVEKMHESKQNFMAGEPYISSATGAPCVTLMVALDDHCVFLDFHLVTLLQRLGLIERHEIFSRLTEIFYMVIGFSLMFFSVMSIGYAFFDYLQQLMHPKDYTIESVFQPIIALTMGLAIFDLAKTLLEREVFFKAYADKRDDSRLLNKFLIAIVIALSIEALMVVFKIALHDKTQMLYALYLIAGIALIIISMGAYSYLDRAGSKSQDEKK